MRDLSIFFNLVNSDFQSWFQVTKSSSSCLCAQNENRYSRLKPLNIYRNIHCVSPIYSFSEGQRIIWTLKALCTSDSTHFLASLNQGVRTDTLLGFPVSQKYDIIWCLPYICNLVFPPKCNVLMLISREQTEGTTLKYFFIQIMLIYISLWKVLLANMNFGMFQGLVNKILL